LAFPETCSHKKPYIVLQLRAMLTITTILTIKNKQAYLIEHADKEECCS